MQVVQSENEHNTGITDDEAIFRSYWSDHIVRDFRRLYLTKLLNDYCKVAIGANRLNWKLIRQAIEADEFGCDFSKFELATKYVLRCRTSRREGFVSIRSSYTYFVISPFLLKQESNS